jgi:hypothetical protein
MYSAITTTARMITSRKPALLQAALQRAHYALGPLASRTGDQAGFSAIDVRVYCCAKLPSQSWLREEKCFAAEVLLERGRRLSAIRELARPQSVRATSGS